MESRMSSLRARLVSVLPHPPSKIRLQPTVISLVMGWTALPWLAKSIRVKGTEGMALNGRAKEQGGRLVFLFAKLSKISLI